MVIVHTTVILALGLISFGGGGGISGSGGSGAGLTAEVKAERGSDFVCWRRGA